MDEQSMTTTDLESAIALDRARREAAARDELARALAEIQSRHRVDPVTVLRVLPSGAMMPGIEFKSR